MKIDNEELQAVSAVAMETPPYAAPRYAAIGGEYKAVPKERLRAAGWKITKTMPPVTQVVPDTWVDMETGEIITKLEARKRGIKLPGARSTSEKALALGERLAGCTPSERPFVRYLLEMRNHRGGLIRPLRDLLDLWIARECPGIRSTDKARKQKQLQSIIERRKLMVSDVTMAKDLQVLNPNITKQGILEEGATAYAKWAARPRP
ncbi:hypothetical protein [Burkholderia diffusa]|uniref:Uncharacterized protein n=1 Tax=Burkholderia diffusa TaxID=488732 RepID=A0A6P2LY46_9BURK|nr:hypothetical protein [Burkholderia diffusa]KAB0657133.1 hypothetical protein F7R23_12100 [Burkholderia diffusa]MBM2655020.1 hypothetical protein [Burkholderia diffusa]VWB75693.1 hypothetical protein BDI24065_03599 [Burkholderia diffusa]